MVEEREPVFKRKKVIMLIIALIIILPVLVYISLLYTGEVKSIIVEKPHELADGTGIAVTAHINMEGAGTVSGKAALTILYEGVPVYNGSITIIKDRGTRELPYSEFVVGNGQYEVRVEFRGKEGVEYYDLTWGVVESLELTAQLDISGAVPKVEVRVLMLDEYGMNLEYRAKRVSVDIGISHEGGESVHHTDEVEENLTYLYDGYDYLSTGSGNYTITATLKNLFTKPDSKYHIIEAEPIERFFNVLPEADAGEDQDAQLIIHPFQLEGSAEVCFDGSNSINIDGEIRVYKWDFDYKDEDNDGYEDFTTDATGVQVCHTYYYSAESWDEVPENITYTVALMIEGDVIIGTDDAGKPIYESSLDTCVVRITIIKVETR